jgi:UDP-3-O-[3-hydroxymyristoyl] glucosamine N-acyltransferase
MSPAPTMSTRTEPNALRLSDIVARLGGELVGDPDVMVRRVAPLQSAGPGDLSFLAQAKYRPQLRETRAAAVVLGRAERDATRLPRILCEDPYLYFARVAQLFAAPDAVRAGVHPSATLEPDASVPASASVGAGAYIGPRARLGERAVVGPGCHVGADVVIGDDSRLHPLVSVYARCRIGRRVIVHSGAVIGADGFGMARDGERWTKIPQVGGVVIGDDVEIGANTTIDRGALEDTVIEEGVKLDNQIQIGHNVRIGAHTAMAGCVGVAGSARIGRHCTVGGAGMILGHLEIADHVNISAGTLVAKSIKEPGTYTGIFPIAENKEWARTAAQLRKLDELARKVRDLEKRLAEPKRGRKK